MTYYMAYLAPDTTEDHFAGEILISASQEVQMPLNFGFWTAGMHIGSKFAPAFAVYNNALYLAYVVPDGEFEN